MRQARRCADLSQRELAALAGMKQPNLARIESGAVEPRPETLERILRAARISPGRALSLWGALIPPYLSARGMRRPVVFGPAAKGVDDVDSVLGLLVRPGPETRVWDLPGLRRALTELLGVGVEVVPDVPEVPVAVTLREDGFPL